MDVLELEDHLEHHGILGMKWGIRRYQNKDGSLTEAGRKRYLNDDGSYNDTAKSEIPNKALTSQEMQSRIDRMRLEKQYKEMLQENDGRIKKILRGAMNNLEKDASRLLSDKVVSLIKDKILYRDNVDSLDISELEEMVKDGDYGDFSVKDLQKIKNATDNLNAIEKFMNGDDNKNSFSKMTINELSEFISSGKANDLSLDSAKDLGNSIDAVNKIKTFNSGSNNQQSSKMDGNENKTTSSYESDEQVYNKPSDGTESESESKYESNYSYKIGQQSYKVDTDESNSVSESKKKKKKK